MDKTKNIAMSKLAMAVTPTRALMEKAIEEAVNEARANVST